MDMNSQIYRLCFTVACGIIALIGCNTNPVATDTDQNPAAPSGATLIVSDGFGGDLSKWMSKYMINENDFYYPMRITDAAAHAGKHSLTTDSNRTALAYEIRATDRVEEGIVGTSFYIMTKATGQINFTVEMGQYGGSSGGLFKSFGMGFDARDSLKCTTFDNYGGRTDKILGVIESNRWYKCKVEVDFTAQNAVYYLDDVKVWESTLPTVEMYGIDRLLVYRGEFAEGQKPSEYSVLCSEGPKQYFIDDIIFYKK
jgi:hypothetical protein